MGASLSNTEHTDFTTTLPHSPIDIDVRAPRIAT